MKLSIISPAFNEEEVLPYYFERVQSVCKNLIENNEITDYEIIVVNDGSTDGTWNLIKETKKSSANIKGIKLSRNFGHHNAISAGLSHCSGDFIIFMDSDLQAEPETIPKFLKEFLSGFDIIWGVAKERKGNPLVKFSSRIYYWFFNKVSGLKIPKDAIMAAASKRALDQILRLKEVRQFALAQWIYVGFKTSFLEIERKERLKGSIKYTFFKRLSLALTSIIGFSKVPLKISSLLGFIMSFLGISLGIFIIIRKLFYGISVTGFASVFSVLTLFFGIQFLILGIMGEYIGIIIDEVKSRPRYIVEEVLE